MSTLHFSMPMVAELNDDHLTVKWAKCFLSEAEIGKLIAQSIYEIPEFQALMDYLNKDGTWCVANVDAEALV